MGWFIVAALVIAFALLVWRRARRTRRSGPDHGGFGPEQTRARVWGNMGSGQDVKHRDQRY
jgi:hypothetical protein